MVIKLSDKQIETVKNGYSEIILNPLQEKAIEEKAMQGIRDEIIQSLRDMRIDITDSEAESIAIDFEESWMHVRYDIQKEWIVDRLELLRKGF